MSRGQAPAVFSTFERLLADNLVLDPQEIEWALACVRVRIGEGWTAMRQ